MNPWDIIGWILLCAAAVVAGAAVLFVLLQAAAWLGTRYMHRKTRDIAPAKGQVWQSGLTGPEIRIENVTEKRVHLYVRERGRGGVLMSEGHGAWRELSRSRVVWLRRGAR